MGTDPAVKRDIVVVGASAGGVEALCGLIGSLPADFPAAVFVVLHVSPSGSLLPKILARVAGVPVAHGEDGEPIEPGRIYVAPPDRHLLIERDRVRVVGGPRQNGHRPAVDPLFRTAAAAYGSRVAAVVLSGTLDDGTLGCRSVKSRGGVTLVQDPDEAAYPGMPANAIKYDSPDLVAPVSALAGLLVDLAAGNGETFTAPTNGDTSAVEVLEGDHEREENGRVSAFTCPECSGTLWEIDDGGALVQFRCRVGHAYSPETMDASQANALEAALWTALRALEERTALKRRLAERLQARESPRVAARLNSAAVEAEEQAALLRQILEGFTAPARSDEPIVGG